mmetsp:Transcript_13496/g.16105  ORF Transcript_13496/g.16105 Transcript_13496/m.16105 type:complete len:196 (-) Transcript_13496:492-1079(-)
MTSRITIFEQGNIENKRVLLVPLNATLDSLIKQAAKELKVVLPKKGAKLFFKNGSVVDEVELVRPNDVLFLCANARTDKFSIAVMGPGSVGKSALTLSYTQNMFVADYDPTIEDAFRKSDIIDGLPCVIDILDTAGQPEYSALRSTWMQNRDALIFVFSIADHSSYKGLGCMFVKLQHLSFYHIDMFYSFIPAIV